MWITPYHQSSHFPNPLSLDDKIAIFFEQTFGWQLDIADQCINGIKDSSGNIVGSMVDSGYAVLHILFSYFEMIAKYKTGFVKDGESKKFFKTGLFDVFPSLNGYPEWVQDVTVSMLYEGVRCGLYHTGVPQSGIILVDNMPDPIALDAPYKEFSKRILINPYKLPTFFKRSFSIIHISIKRYK